MYMYNSEWIFYTHMNIKLDINIFVISQPKWVKYGLKAHFLKMFTHAKFQLSITCTFKIILLKYL